MKNRALVEYIVSFVVLLILSFYTYIELVVGPYHGFYFDETNGKILAIFVPADGRNTLQLGDALERVGTVTWEHYRADKHQPLFEGFSPGQEVEIAVTRNGESILLLWTMPGSNSAEFFNRLANVWWLSYLFWLAGLATVMVIRPLDLRQQLLVAFLYLTALWLMLGATGGNHLWHSALLFRAFIWLCMPVYLHLHWVFPEPIRRIPTKFWIPLYLIGIGLAVAEWFQLPPVDSSVFGILIAMGGSLFLLAVHYALKREQRRDIAILGIITTFAFLPSIIYLSINFVTAPVLFFVVGLFTLTGLPGAYFYVAYRQQPGWPELRANRVVALYLFLILIFVVALLSATLISRIGLGNDLILATTLALLGIVIVSIIGYPSFQRLVEHRLLGMPLAPERVVETYTTSITTTLDRGSLAKILSEEIMPSLQIRQSTLVQQGGNNQPDIIYAAGIEPEQIAALEKLESMERRDSRPQLALPGTSSWVRLTVPLKLEGAVIGTWLFGRRDPNDIYSEADIHLLELLANQTAISLANINQTHLLQNLYAANIQRQEEERTNLARVLHDDVLNDLAVLSLHRGDDGRRFATTYEGLVSRIRLMVRGLRPAMLDYGLWRALDDLLDDLQDRAAADVVLKFDVPKNETRYPVVIEQHLFRIVQQAVENALEHAQPDSVQIQGHLQQNEVSLVVEDDGRGLPHAQQLDMSNLLENKHYGLVGMFERAEIIGAQLNITSEANEFTIVSLEWHLPREESSI